MSIPPHPSANQTTATFTHHPAPITVTSSTIIIAMGTTKYRWNVYGSGMGPNAKAGAANSKNCNNHNRTAVCRNTTTVITSAPTHQANAIINNRLRHGELKTALSPNSQVPPTRLTQTRGT